ncbi:MAG: rhodanese-like domain-containing protein [Blautia sp.]|nr:rhodanese-like domain-containing protein [Blautia sp.]
MELKLMYVQNSQKKKHKIWPSSKITPNQRANQMTKLCFFAMIFLSYNREILIIIKKALSILLCCLPLFPKNKTLFVMCQGGGRASQIMSILKARGWDMSKVYNVGGMGHYTGAEYKDLVTDTPEITLTATYNFEGLTRIAPAE